MDEQKQRDEDTEMKAYKHRNKSETNEDEKLMYVVHTYTGIT